MQPKPEHPRRKYRWGMPASAAAHLLLLLVLVFGLPLPEFEPEKPDAVAVELVPVPAAEEPQDARSEALQGEETQPPQQPAEAEQAAAPPIQMLQPVFRFGEEDTGPEIAEEGDAAEDAARDEAAVEPQPEAAVPGIAVPAEKPPLELTEAKTLFSRSISRDLVAMNAIGTLTRDERASELCATELREQLRHAEPPWRPDLLPAYRIGAGTVIEVRDGAFHASGEWYDLSFRCEIDPDATVVLNFAFTVGDAIPRGEWTARGFPNF